MVLKTYKKISVWQIIFGKEPKPFSTLGQFKKIQAVNLITNIGITVYLLLFLTIIICEKSVLTSRNPILLGILAFVPSIAELTSVFIGFVLGFYWQESDKIKTRNIERLEIYRSIKNELEYNKNIVDKILSTRIEYNIPFLFKTSTWEIYKEKIGEFKNEPNSELLTNMYHNIIQLNEMVKMKPMIYYSYDDKIVNSLKEKIVEDYSFWVKYLTEKYKEWNINF